MASYVFANDSVGTGVRATLAGSDVAYVRAGVLVASSDTTAIYAYDPSTALWINGAVVGRTYALILGRLPTEGGHSITIEAGAEVGGFEAAIYAAGTGSRVKNAGTIWSEGTAIAIEGSSGLSTVTSTITNEGRITSFSGIRNIGTDSVQLTNTGTIDSGSGWAYASLTDAADIIYNRGKIIGSIDLGSGADVYDGSKGTLTGAVLGRAGNDTLLGGNGADFFRGGDGNDSLKGGSGNDSLYGDAGNDKIDGGSGSDYMEGGAGNDTYVTDGGDTIKEQLNGGTDTVRSSASHKLSANVENLTLTGKGDLAGKGNSLANIITGNSGKNVLSGEAGNDTLSGGGGADRLTGGSGKDQFLFNSSLGGGNIDTITDYNVADDTIRLENAIFTALSTGKLAAAAFVANTNGKAADASDRIVYESDTGKLFYDADGTGSAGAVQFALLAKGLALSAADFFVI